MNWDWGNFLQVIDEVIEQISEIRCLIFLFHCLRSIEGLTSKFLHKLQIWAYGTVLVQNILDYPSPQWTR